MGGVTSPYSNRARGSGCVPGREWNHPSGFYRLLDLLRLGPMVGSLLLAQDLRSQKIEIPRAFHPGKHGVWKRALALGDYPYRGCEFSALASSQAASLYAGESTKPDRRAFPSGRPQGQDSRSCPDHLPSARIVFMALSDGADTVTDKTSEWCRMSGSGPYLGV